MADLPLNADYKKAITSNYDKLVNGIHSDDDFLNRLIPKEVFQLGIVEELRVSQCSCCSKAKQNTFCNLNIVTILLYVSFLSLLFSLR